MVKRDYFLIVPLLVVTALVFGASEGVDAKAWPNCPSEGIHNQGPGIRAHFEFLIFVVQEDPLLIREDLEISSGACKNISLMSPQIIYDVEWSELDTNDDGLDKNDLKGNIFEIKNTDDPLLWGLMQACFGLDIGVQAVCLKILSVHNFTDNGDGTYSADVTLVRVIT